MGRRASWLRSPHRFHATVAVLFTAFLALGLFALLRHSFTWHWYHFVAAWLISVNVIAVGYYAYDKHRACGGGRRVPEMVLHGLALAGGSPGAWLAMRLFRHKTIKGSFRLAFWLIVVVQLLLVAWIVTLVWRHS
jgi:uncharacterized membrane protein YsdA (DUF1294 family)